MKQLFSFLGAILVMAGSFPQFAEARETSMMRARCVCLCGIDAEEGAENQDRTQLYSEKEWVVQGYEEHRVWGTENGGGASGYENLISVPAGASFAEIDAACQANAPTSCKAFGSPEHKIPALSVPHGTRYTQGESDLQEGTYACTGTPYQPAPKKKAKLIRRPVYVNPSTSDR